MQNPPHLEVPDSVRKMAEQNVEQARRAYNEFMEMARKAQDMLTSSSGVMNEAVRDVQTKTLSYAEKNMEAGFDFITELSKARDLKQYLEIQQRHTQKSMQAFNEQAQELGRMMAEAAKKGGTKG